MNRVVLLSSCLAVSLGLFASVAHAQPPNRMPPSIRPLVFLALEEPVLKELGIANDAPVVAEMRKQSQTLRHELSQRLNDSVRKAAQGGEPFNPKTEEEKLNAELQKLLTPEQYARLRQIHWQRAGIYALNDAEVVKALELTSDQQKQLAALQREAFEKQFELRNTGTAAEERKKKRYALTLEWEQEVNKILSQTQRDKLAEPENRDQMSWADLIRPEIKPEIVKALDITDQQQAKLATLSRDMQKRAGDLLKGELARARDEQMQAKQHGIVAEHEKQAYAVLTAEQQKKLADLKGKAFDLESLGQ